MPTTPAWRVDDAAAYESLRAAASALVTRLLEAGGVQRAAVVRQLVLAVDGFDRSDVDAAFSILAEMRWGEQ